MYIVLVQYTKGGPKNMGKIVNMMPSKNLFQTLKDFKEDYQNLYGRNFNNYSENLQEMVIQGI